MSPDAQPLSKVTRSSTAKPGDEVLVLRSGAADPKDRVVLVPAKEVAAGGLTLSALLTVLGAGTGVTLTVKGSKLIIDSILTTAQAPAQPEAPTDGRVDDIGNNLNGGLVPGYPAVADYEVFGAPGFPGVVNASAAGGDVQNGRIFSRNLTGEILPGGAGIRVAASGARPAGKWLLNATAFTGPSVVTPPAGDTTAPVISITVPTAGAVLTVGQAVTLTAQATDNVAVTGVTFTNGATGAVLGTGAKNGNAYTYSYTPTAAGALTITATAVDAAGNSQAASVSVTVQAVSAPATKLDAPTGLSLVPLSSSTIGASWNPVANATGYRLRLNGSTTYMPGTATSYVLTGLAAATTVSVDVQALYAGSGPYLTSDYSAAQQSTTPATNTPTKRLLVLGNSLDAIDTSTGGGYYSPSGTWAAKALPTLGSAWVAPAANNYAVSGVQTSHFLATQLPQALSAHQAGGYALDVCFVGSPVNDFIIGGDTAANAYARLKNIMRQLRAAGIQVVHAPCTTCNKDYGNYPLSFVQAQITEYNRLLELPGAQGDMGFNALIYWDKDSRLNNLFGTEGTGISHDGLHFEDNGNAIKASIAAPVIAAITASVYTPSAAATPVGTFGIVATADMTIVGQDAVQKNGVSISYDTNSFAYGNSGLGPGSGDRGFMSGVVDTGADVLLGLATAADIATARTASQSYSGVRFGAHTLDGTLTASAWQNQADTGTSITYAAGNVFKVQVTGTTAYLYVNNVLRYTFQNVPAETLYPIIVIQKAGKKVSNLLISSTNLVAYNAAAVVAAPAAPTNLVATAQVGGNALDWDDTPDAVSYNILRNTNGSPGGQQIGTSPTSDYFDATASTTTASFYSAQAVNAAGAISANSNLSDGVTALATTPTASTTTYQESDALIAYSQPWTLFSNAGFDDGSAAGIQATNAVAAFTFTGTQFFLDTAQYGGLLLKYDVYVNEVKQATVTTQGASQACAERFASAVLSQGTYNVKIVSRASYNAYAWLDRIRVAGTLQTYAGNLTVPA